MSDLWKEFNEAYNVGDYEAVFKFKKFESENEADKYW